MAFINEYPYADFNEYNLDWVIKKMVDLIEEWAETKTEWGDMKLEFEALKQYVIDKLSDENLGPFIDQYVNEKIDEMVSNGTMAAIIAPYMDYIIPEMYGCAGDGVTDDSVNFKTACDACRDNNQMLYLPKKSKYLLSSETVIDNVKCIQGFGTIIAPNKLVIQGVSTQVGEYDITLDKVDGIVKIQGIKNGMFKIIDADGLELYADSTVTGIGSIAYNSFYLGSVGNVNIHSKGSGWINENTFFGGRFTGLTIGDQDGEGTYRHNNNHFYNPCLEAATLNIYAGKDNYIHGARFEGTNYFNFYERAEANVIEQTWLGEHLPRAGYITLENWNDISGKNYYKQGALNATHVSEFYMDVDSKNYQCDKLYPLSGKLHAASYNYDLFISDMIDITNGIGLVLYSDVAFFRPRIYIYDENKDPITTEPANSPLIGASMTFNSAGYYILNSNVQRLRLSIARYAMSTPFSDSGVKYIKVDAHGYGSANMEYFKAVLTSQAQILKPIIADTRLRATAVPSNGEWNDGDYCVNIGSTQCAGWVYNNGTWHAVGTWT